MKSGRPRCVTCTYRCPRKRERVRNRTHRDRDPSATMLCATNNITYPSWCHIVKDACVTGFVLETRHAGPCNAYDTSPLYIGKSSTRDYVDNTRLLVNEYCCSSRSLFKLSLYSSSRCWTRTYSNIRIILFPSWFVHYYCLFSFRSFSFSRILLMKSIEVKLLWYNYTNYLHYIVCQLIINLLSREKHL